MAFSGFGSRASESSLSPAPQPAAAAFSVTVLSTDNTHRRRAEKESVKNHKKRRPSEGIREMKKSALEGVFFFFLFFFPLDPFRRLFLFHLSLFFSTSLPQPKGSNIQKREKAFTQT